MDRKVLEGRDYIETIDWSMEELDEVIAVSRELKDQRRRGEHDGPR